jgi:hypothetical protein
MVALSFSKAIMAIDFQKFNFQPVGLKKFPQGVKFICPIKLRALRNELGGEVW